MNPTRAADFSEVMSSNRSSLSNKEPGTPDGCQSVAFATTKEGYRDELGSNRTDMQGSRGPGLRGWMGENDPSPFFFPKLQP